MVMEGHRIHDKFLERLHVLLTKFRKTGRMTLMHINVVNTFITGEIEDNRILQSASETFRLRFIAALVELSTLSSVDLTSAQILGRICGKLFCTLPNTSIVWEQFHRICETIIRLFCAFSAERIDHQISIFYEEGKSMSVSVMSEQHILALFTMVCTTVSTFCCEQGVGSSVGSTNCCITMAQVIRLAKLVDEPNPLPSICVISLLDALSHPFIISSISADAKCEVCGAVMRWQYIELQRLLAVHHRCSSTNEESTDNLSTQWTRFGVTFQGLLLVIRRMLWSYGEPNRPAMLLEGVESAVHAVSGYVYGSVAETGGVAKQSTLPCPSVSIEVLREALCHLTDRGKWGSSEEDWVDMIANSSGQQPLVIDARKGMAMDILRNADVLAKYRFQHPQPPINVGWMSRRTRPSPMDHSVVHGLQITGSTTAFAEFLAVNAATILKRLFSPDRIPGLPPMSCLLSYSRGLDNLSCEAAHRMRSMTHFLLDIIVNSTTACPSDVSIEQSELLDLVVRVAEINAECLHSASSLLSNLLSSAPSTSMAVLSWATQCSKDPGSRGSKRRIDTITPPLTEAEEVDNGIKRRGGPAADQWDRHFTSLNRLGDTDLISQASNGTSCSNAVPAMTMVHSKEVGHVSQSAAQLLKLLDGSCRVGRDDVVEMPSVVAFLKRLSKGSNVSASYSVDGSSSVNDRFCEKILAAEALAVASVSCLRKDVDGAISPLIPGGPWSENCVMENAMNQYVEVVEHTVARYTLHLSGEKTLRDTGEIHAYRERVKAVMTSMARILAIQPFLFVHWVPYYLQHERYVSSPPDGLHATERCFIALIVKLCSLPCQFPDFYDSLVDTNELTMQRVEEGLGKTVERSPNEEGCADSGLYRTSSAGDIVDTLSLQQRSPGEREIDTILTLFRRNRWNDVLAFILARAVTTVALACKADNDSLSQLLHTVHSVLYSMQATSGSCALMLALSRQVRVMFDVTISTKLISDKSKPVAPFSRLADLRRIVLLVKDIIAPLSPHGEYLRLFRNSHIPDEVPRNPSSFSRGASCLSNLVVLAIREKWTSSFDEEICQLMRLQSDAGDILIANLGAVWLHPGSILKCNVRQDHPGNLGSFSGLEPRQVLEVCQTACGIRGWAVMQGLRRQLPERSAESDATVTDEMIQIIWNVAQEMFDDVSMAFSSCPIGGSDESNLEVEKVYNCSSVISLLVLLRLWSAVNRCSMYGAALLLYTQDDTPTSSVASHVRALADILPMGKAIDEMCKRLSEQAPPHWLLSRLTADLLGIGLLDSSFKCSQFSNRDNVLSSVNDVWWKKVAIVGLNPGGMLVTAAAALHRAVEELSRDETNRLEAEQSSRPTDGRRGSTELTDKAVAKLTNTVWVCLPALSQLVKSTALNEPEIAVWALSSLIQAAEPPQGCRVCGWTFHMILETFVDLCAHTSEDPQSGLLMKLLTGDHPQLAADIFFRPVLHSPSLLELLVNVANTCGFDLHRLISSQFPYIIHSVLMYQDSTAYMVLRQVILKSSPSENRVSSSANGETRGEYSASSHHPNSSKVKPRKTSKRRDSPQQLSPGSFHGVIDKNPMCIFRILASEVMTSPSIQDLIHGQLLEIMETQYAAPLNKTMRSDGDTSADFPSTGAVQRMLRYLVWNLGSHSDAVVSSTHRALRIMCTLIRGNSWEVPRSRMIRRKNGKIPTEAGMQDDGVSSNVDSNVAYVLNKNFLYILTNSIQKNWATKRPDAQTHSLRLLGSLMKLLRADDLAKVLPKIIFTTDTALSSTSAVVRWAAVRVVGDLMSLLPPDVLKGDVSVLLIGLYPIIENCGSTTQQRAGRKMSKTVRADLIAQLRGPFVDDANAVSEAEMLETVEQSTQEASKKLESICVVLCFEELSLRQELAARREAIAIINTLFRSDAVWEIIRPAMTSLVRLPNLALGCPCEGEEELTEATVQHQVVRDGLTLPAAVENLCGMLKLESTQVAALDSLTSLCAEEGQSLRSSLVSSVSGALPADSLICVVLRHLLELSAHESDLNVRVACARCLGELGALDPAKVSISLAALRSDVHDGSEHHRPPWELSESEFGLFLVEKYLVPGLRVVAGNVYAQDRICFAIQEVLRIMAGTSVVAETFNRDKSMPQSLREVLAGKNILDLTEPYWSTNYTFTEAAAKLTCPIFRSNFSVQRWLGLWCRFLLFKSRGPFSNYFSACRGAVRTRVEMSQFLLPYLVVDVLAFPPRESANDASDTLEEVDADLEGARANVIKSIVAEICTVLRVGADAAVESDGGRCGQLSTGLSRPGRLSRGMLDRAAVAGFRGADNAGSHMSVQAVFLLLDTLGRWRGLASEKATAVNNYYGTAEKVNCRSIGQHLQILIDAVPKALLGHAAVRIGAHARGMKYFELLAREEHLSRRHNRVEDAVVNLMSAPDGGEDAGGAAALLPLVKRYDCANGALPILSVDMVDSMMEICAALDDADALQGIEKMRQVYGYPSTSYNRLLEMEHTESWMEALQEYDRLQMQLETRHGEVDSGDVDATLALVERGRVRCLLEMGQLEAVLDQVQGRSSRMAAVEPALLPSAVRAAWQLLKWDQLDELLVRCERVQTTFEHSRKSNTLESAERCRGRDIPKPSLYLTVADFLNGKASSNVFDLGEMKRSSPLRIHKEDNFELSMGYLMSCVHGGHRNGFDMAVRDFRVETMTSLATACAESYNRAYPFLVRLHILREAEHAYELVHGTHSCNGDQVHCCNSVQATSGAATPMSNHSLDSLTSLRNQKMIDWGWSKRLEMMAPSVHHRGMLLAFRRSIMSMCDMQDKIAENWMVVSKLLRKVGRYDMSRVSIRNAVQSGLNEEEALIQESIVLKDSGCISKALMLLEPVELDIAYVRHCLKTNPTDAACSALMTLEDKQKHRLAHRLLLSARWMSASHVRHGDAITDRYKVALALHKNWEVALFEMGQYYSTMSKYQKDELPAGNVIHKMDSTEQAYISSSIRAVESYIHAVRYGHEHLMQALPKLLTIWFSCTSLSHKNESTTKNASSGDAAMLAKFLKKMNLLMQSAQKKFPPAAWFACLPQIVSRIGHPHPDVVNLIKDIVTKVLSEFPEQGLWFIACLKNSLRAERRVQGEAIVTAAVRELKKKGKTDQATMLTDSANLFVELVEVARAQPSSRRVKLQIGTSCTLNRFIVPIQSALKISYPPVASRQQQCGPGGVASPEVGHGASAMDEATTDTIHFPCDQMRIHKFDENIDVMATKAKPKRIQIFTTCGRTIKFLLKQEQNGDLRKDARMMEFNAVVNRIMQEEPESRKRKLRLRTYSVVCLNEECGILEWVPNTSGLRPLINETSNSQPDLFPSPNFRDIRIPFEDMQKKHFDYIEKLVEMYGKLVLKNNVPCLHRWFLNAYTDPTEWLDARTTFTRSCAVWSAVGHVMGLGDRHGENILLDTENAECMHVDFDCLFDKGLSLARPEIVPFRLTPNMVDAMGPTGVEGCFRRSMEVCLGLLRDNKDPLLSVIEPFLRDPTVAWCRGGRAQRVDEMSARSGRTARPREHFEDSENENAGNMLRDISERLDGIYNIRHPLAQTILTAYRNRRQTPPRIGLGAFASGQHEDMIALSVSGQVQKLIEEATAESNLAQMFVGWMPWL